jgi:hypothetical protein
VERDSDVASVLLMIRFACERGLRPSAKPGRVSVLLVKRGERPGPDKEMVMGVRVADVKADGYGRGDVSNGSEKCDVAVWERVVDGCV